MEKVKTGKDFIGLKKLRAKLLMQYYRGPLELRLDAEEKLYHVAKNISTLIVPLSVEEHQEAGKLDKVMSLFEAYHSCGSAMEQAMIYEEINKYVESGGENKLI